MPILKLGKGLGHARDETTTRIEPVRGILVAPAKGMSGPAQVLLDAAVKAIGRMVQLAVL